MLPLSLVDEADWAGAEDLLARVEGSLEQGRLARGVPGPVTALLPLSPEGVESLFPGRAIAIERLEPRRRLFTAI